MTLSKPYLILMLLFFSLSSHANNISLDSSNIAQYSASDVVDELLIDENSSKFDFSGMQDSNGNYPYGKQIDQGRNTNNTPELTDLTISFLITWIILLSPPLLARAVRKKPYSKVFSVFFVSVFFFLDHIIFIALGSVNNTHFPIILGSFIGYLILIRTNQKNEFQDILGTVNDESEKRALPKSLKLFVIFSAFWVIWVIVRTYYDFELIGIEFYRWDDDFLLINLITPPILYLLFWYFWNWLHTDSANQ